MKSRIYLLLFVIILSSCEKKHETTRPIVLDASYGRFSSYIIIGSDTQQVDSIYNKYFNDIFYKGYGNEDSVYTNSYIEKYYISLSLEKEVNNYIFDYFKPCVVCNLSEIYVTEYYYAIATGSDGGAIQCCLYDRQHALTFYYGLKKLIDKSPYFMHRHELTENFGPMINIHGLFPNAKDSTKLLMNASQAAKKRYVDTMRQKRERYKEQFKWAQKIDSIKAAIAKGQMKDK